jgi:protein-tyrosine phosphatase
MKSLRLLFSFTMAIATAACGSADTGTDSSTGALSGTPPPASSAGTPAKAAPAVHVDGLPNLRDLGGHVTADGHHVRAGLVFRSEQPANATDSSQLLALHLERMADFRGQPEIEGHEDPTLSGMTELPLPIFDTDHPEDDLGAQLGAKIGELASAQQDPSSVEQVRADVDAWSATLASQMTKAYEVFVTDPRAGASFKGLVTTVAQGNVTLFHCVSGKDRTGFAAAIILRGLGVPWRDVVTDYLATNQALAQENQKKISGIAAQFWPDMPGHQSATVLQTILGVDEAFITASFAKLQAQFGAAHPPTSGDVASDEAIAAFYDATFGAGVQDALKKSLLE